MTFYLKLRYFGLRDWKLWGSTRAPVSARGVPSFNVGIYSRGSTKLSLNLFLDSSSLTTDLALLSAHRLFRSLPSSLGINLCYVIGNDQQTR